MIPTYRNVYVQRALRVLSIAAVGLVLAAVPRVAEAAQVDASCAPDEVMVFAGGPRLHVRCAWPTGNIKYFALAVSSTNAADAARVLSVINTALVAGRTLTIKYDPNDLSGAAIGCLNSDCRLIQAVGFGK